MKLKPLDRPEISVDVFNSAIAELQAMAPVIREEAGPGAFLHPHEILGCATDQMAKLTAVTTQAVYTEDPTEVKKRCLKFAYALLFAAASLDVMSEPMLSPGTPRAPGPT